MCDHISDAMVEHGIASKYDTKVKFNEMREAGTSRSPATLLNLQQPPTTHQHKIETGAPNVILLELFNYHLKTAFNQ